MKPAAPVTTTWVIRHRSAADVRTHALSRNRRMKKHSVFGVRSNRAWEGRREPDSSRFRHTPATGLRSNRHGRRPCVHAACAEEMVSSGGGARAVDRSDQSERPRTVPHLRTAAGFLIRVRYLHAARTKTLVDRRNSGASLSRFQAVEVQMTEVPFRRVLLLTAGLGPGGLERQLTLLATHLPARWRPVVLSLNGGPFVDELQRSDVAVRIGRRRGRLDPLPFAGLSSFHHRHAPGRGPLLALATGGSGRPGVPAVWHSPGRRRCSLGTAGRRLPPRAP